MAKYDMQYWSEERVQERQNKDLKLNIYKEDVNNFVSLYINLILKHSNNKYRNKSQIIALGRLIRKIMIEMEGFL